MKASPNSIEYKGLIGGFTYDEDSDLFEGSITNIEELVLFQGKSIEELTSDFQEAVDDYLNWYKHTKNKTKVS